MRRGLYGVCLLTVGVLCTFGRVAPGQSLAVIRGTVTDPSGSVIQGAEVRVVGPGGKARSTATNRDGKYSIQGFTPDTYIVIVSAPGFEVARNENVAVASGQTQIVDFELKIALKPETVKVSSGDDQEQKSLGAALHGKQVESLPDDATQLKDTLNTLAAQTAGAGPIQIYVNGFPSDSLPPKSSIGQVRVNEDPYSAEYSGAGSGRIEVTTKPGSDSFHGQIDLAGTDSALNARNPLVETQPSYHSLAPAGQVGGPINKWASYFVDGAYVHSESIAAVSALVLDPQFNPVPFSQSVPTGINEGRALGRLDLQAGSKTTVSVLYDFENQSAKDSGTGGLTLASAGMDTSLRSQTLQVNGTTTLPAQLVNEIGFQMKRSVSELNAASLAPTLTVQGAFVGGGSSQGDSTNRDDHYRFRDNLSWNWDKHLLKFGGQANFESISNNSTNGFNGQFLFSSLGSYQITEQGLSQGLSPVQVRAAGGGASQFTITAGKQATSASLVDASAYVEDKWTPKPNLSITPGVRIQGEFGSYGHADVAPRLGFTWGIDARNGQPAKTTVSGGYGWSYTPFPLNSILQLKMLNGIRQQQYVVNAPDFFPTIPPLSSLPLEPGASPTLYQVSQIWRDAYSQQGTIFVRRGLNLNTSVFLGFAHSRTVHQSLARNINAPLPGTYDPSDPTSDVRPFGNNSYIYEYRSDGTTNRNLALAGLQIHASSKAILYAGYQFQDAHSDVTGGFPSNPYDIAADYGRMPVARHTVSAYGQFSLPFQIDISPMLSFSSSAPFNIVLDYDLNGDGVFNDRPTFATDLSRPSVVFTKWGTFDTLPIPGQTTIPFDYGNGPSQFVGNVYVSKSFLLGRRHSELVSSQSADHGGGAGSPAAVQPYKLKFAASVANVFNVVNPGPPIGTLGSSLFGRSNTVLPGRLIYLQSTFSF